MGDQINFDATICVNSVFVKLSQRLILHFIMHAMNRRVQSYERAKVYRTMSNTQKFQHIGTLLLTAVKRVMKNYNFIQRIQARSREKNKDLIHEIYVNLYCKKITGASLSKYQQDLMEKVEEEEERVKLISLRNQAVHRELLRNNFSSAKTNRTNERLRRSSDK